MLLYYIRHGDPIYNPDSLTELGHKQAQALSLRLANADLDTIYASTSNRAQQTAYPTAKLINKPVELLDWCNEDYVWKEFTVKCGEYLRWIYQDEQMLQLFVKDDFLTLGEQWYKHPVVYSKKLEKGIIRIKQKTYDFLAKLGYVKASDGNYYVASKPNTQRIALFAHEGFGMVFLSTILGIPYPTFCSCFALEHSGMTVISFDGDKIVVPKILQLNNDSHLFKAELPTNYNNGIKI